VNNAVSYQTLWGISYFTVLIQIYIHTREKQDGALMELVNSGASQEKLRWPLFWFESCWHCQYIDCLHDALSHRCSAYGRQVSKREVKHSLLVVRKLIWGEQTRNERKILLKLLLQSVWHAGLSDFVIKYCSMHDWWWGPCNCPWKNWVKIICVPFILLLMIQCIVFFPVYDISEVYYMKWDRNVARF
jgi:hypothetical protein